MLNQNDLEFIIDQVQRGILTADQANVEKVRLARVQIVGSLLASVRSVLNAAVQRGDLGHMKKDNHKPEVYYHPSFEHLANLERNNAEMQTLNAIMSVCK